MGLARRSSLVGSQTSSTMSQVLKYKPRLFALMAGFICTCAVTVGVLGWQLTMSAGKQNVGALIEEIEFLVSNQVSNYILQSAETLLLINAKQAELFRTNKWSFSTPERAKLTFESQLVELKGASQFTTSMYVNTYPAGYQVGYNYGLDTNGNPQLQWWNQSGMTAYTYLCDSNGTPIGSPISVDFSAGNGTLENAGNNNTLANAVGGITGVNLEYALGEDQGFTSTYVFSGSAFKTAYYFVTNQVTGEQTTFGNDWTLDFISNQIRTILSIVSFPIFAAVIECDTGTVIGTSSLIPTVQNDTILKINEINDPFFQDFSQFVNTTNRYGTVNNLPPQLSIIASYIGEYFPGTANWFVERKIGTANWKLGMNAYVLNGKQLLFIVYMNIDSVEQQLNKLSAQTGYMMIGIIGSFVVVGILFAILISRQLYVVVKQIQLLKDLKFREVLGGSAEIKNRSFIYELAELQKCFHSMVLVFSDLLKKNSTTTRPSTTDGGPPQGSPTPNNASGNKLFASKKPSTKTSETANFQTPLRGIPSVANNETDEIRVGRPTVVNEDQQKKNS
ncbi:hypothetical protein BCR33DRAFT_789400 [Rhizoclosmatium globosum]|uniref:Uncharacterized protein n=1 Tax=Rhizoclosmatium globosum TaxID=329046 RepID=A0A1Y2BTB1_9FUNG|nr:hypothetical protein BCR33DRAFT_789400 [Rhizoclosmatium globosum]|eukprot:ORY38002.1 hypothetical protein BCR33DRAFT_789400 [Rhizoclosmatium globosum]